MADPSGWRRWVVYQRERFPLAGHAPLIMAFSVCAVLFSARLRGAWPSAGAATAAFVTSLLFFLQLRIADEFKDVDEDRRWRAYRPVPRGLVSLSELRIVFILAAALQLGTALFWFPPLLAGLMVTWAYLAAMTVEFGCRSWLKARPVAYLLSHMVIMPLIDLYATACDWGPALGRPPRGLVFFLAASFANGVVIELGRKLRSPADEEPGVETYSALWGPRRAALAWWSAVGITLLFAVLAARELGAALPVGIVLTAGFLARGVLSLWFSRRLKPGDGRWLEIASGLWSLLLYGSLGLLPLFFGGRGG